MISELWYHVWYKELMISYMISYSARFQMVTPLGMREGKHARRLLPTSVFHTRAHHAAYSIGKIVCRDWGPCTYNSAELVSSVRVSAIPALTRRESPGSPRSFLYLCGSDLKEQVVRSASGHSRNQLSSWSGSWLKLYMAASVQTFSNCPIRPAETRWS